MTMFGLLFGLPFHFIRGISRMGGGRGYRRVPRYGHDYCTVRHLSQDTADRCSQTARYRRARAEGVARENARWAAQRADEAERAAWARVHPVRSRLGDYVFLVVFSIGAITLVICMFSIYG